MAQAIGLQLFESLKCFLISRGVYGHVTIRSADSGSSALEDNDD